RGQQRGRDRGCPTSHDDSLEGYASVPGTTGADPRGDSSGANGQPDAPVVEVNRGDLVDRHGQRVSGDPTVPGDGAHTHRVAQTVGGQDGHVPGAGGRSRCQRDDGPCRRTLVQVEVADDGSVGAGDRGGTGVAGSRRGHLPVPVGQAAIRATTGV